MKITLVKGIGFIINLVWTGWGQGPAEGTDPLPVSPGHEELYRGSTTEESLQGGRGEEGGDALANSHQAGPSDHAGL